MKSPYFCVFHAQRLQARESEAITGWSQIMHQGIKAYNECRTGDAYTYLAAAIDIALLRSECAINGIFTELHLIKPAEFIIQLQLAEQRIYDAIHLLDRLSRVDTLPACSLGPTLGQFIELERRHIEAVKEIQKPVAPPLQYPPEHAHQSAAILPFRRH